MNGSLARGGSAAEALLHPLRLVPFRVRSKLSALVLLLLQFLLGLCLLFQLFLLGLAVELLFVFRDEEGLSVLRHTLNGQDRLGLSA